MRRTVTWFLACLMPLVAHAVILEKPLTDHAMESRAQALFAQMRCVVCEGQPLSESDAHHAIDMRATIRQMMVHGDSDDQIRDFFHSRYGDAIFMRPPTRGAAMPLWVAPFLLLAFGVACMLFLRKRKEP